jgi:hypothetical protein
MNQSVDTLKLYELLFQQVNTLGWTLLLAYVARLAQQYLMHRLTVLQHGVFEAIGDCACTPTDATSPGTSTGTNAIGFQRTAAEPDTDVADVA